MAGRQARTVGGLARPSGALGLYVHSPFCQAICSYCNFNRGLLDEGLKRRYVDALLREIGEAGSGAPADTVFFGGGTPSLLDEGDVGRIIEACRAAFDLAPDAEITLETNPETASLARLGAFRAAGVNRISFGVQSFDDAELARLGRIHSAARAVQAIEDARRAGFENLSFDLMLWLPGQSPDSWRRTVDRATGLAPDHVSLYLLELYPNAPLKEAMARGAAHDRRWVQTTDDEAADMYLEGLARLDEAGFEQYEISNVSKPGRTSRHNLKYWESGAWLGFGCGAHSTTDTHRWRNVTGTSDYIERIDSHRPVEVDRRERLPLERREEALFTGLRLAAGIDRLEFAGRFGIDPWEEYGENLASYVDSGFMWVSPERFGLTRHGMLVANEILTEFV